MIFNDSVRDSKIFDFYLVILSLQIPYMNLTHKSVVLLVRVPDLKARKPTPADLNSQTQQEVDTGAATRDIEKKGRQGRSGSRSRPWSLTARAWQQSSLRGPPAVLRAL